MLLVLWCNELIFCYLKKLTKLFGKNWKQKVIDIKSVRVRRFQIKRSKKNRYDVISLYAHPELQRDTLCDKKRILIRL